MTDLALSGGGARTADQKGPRSVDAPPIARHVPGTSRAEHWATDGRLVDLISTVRARRDLRDLWTDGPHTPVVDAGHPALHALRIARFASYGLSRARARHVCSS